MKLLAIDPGNIESAWVLYANGKPLEWAKFPNKDVRYVVETSEADHLAIEMIASYGMPVGAEVFETCVAVGRFIEAWRHNFKDGLHRPLPPSLVYRKQVALHLCSSPRANDSNVRQAILDRFGGKETAIGRKGSYGPLHGVSGDVWAALGVAITAAETMPDPTRVSTPDEAKQHIAALREQLS